MAFAAELLANTVSRRAHLDKKHTTLGPVAAFCASPEGKKLSQICPLLYLGSADNVKGKKELRERGIKVIVNAAAEIPNALPGVKDWEYVRLELHDEPSDSHNLARVLDGTVDRVLERMRSGDAVAVHCRSGVSRSGSIVLAVIMRLQANGLDPSKKLPAKAIARVYGPVAPALEYVRARRSIVRPNKGFMVVLQDAHRNTAGAASASASAAAPKIVTVDIAYAALGLKLSLIRLDASAPINAIKKKLVMKVGVEADAMRVFYESKEILSGTLADAGVSNDGCLLEVKSNAAPAVDFSSAPAPKAAAAGSGFAVAKKRKTVKPKGKVDPDFEKAVASAFSVGARVQRIKDKALGHVRYVGAVASLSAGFWLGVELDDAVGRNDGSVKGVKLFSTSPNRGTAGRPSTFELVRVDESRLQMFVRDVMVSYQFTVSVLDEKAGLGKAGSVQQGQGRICAVWAPGGLDDEYEDDDDDDEPYTYNVRHRSGQVHSSILVAKRLCRPYKGQRVRAHYGLAFGVGDVKPGKVTRVYKNWDCDVKFDVLNITEKVDRCFILTEDPSATEGKESGATEGKESDDEEL